MTRIYRPRERDYVKAYVFKAYPNARRYFFNQRLGRPPTELLERYPGTKEAAFQVWKKTCDCIVVTDDEIVLIEGKIRRPLDGLGELLVYEDIVIDTPELKEYLTLPIRLELVSPLEDPSVTRVAHKNGVRVVIFKTTESMQYLKETGWAV